jgi:hypothetical protein
VPSGDTGIGSEGGTSAGNGRSAAPRLEVTGTQVCASALASVSGATVASLFGVAGTVIGAGTMSVVATVGGAVYSFWLRRTHARLQEAPITTRVVDLMSSAVGDRTTSEVEGAGEVPTEVDATAVADATDVETDGTAEAEATQQESDQGEDRRADSPWGWVSQRRWGVAAGVAVVFAVSLGFVTLVELVGQRPLSSIAGGESSDGTSIGTLVDGDDSSSSDDTPTTTTTDASTDTSDPDAVEDSSEPEPSGEEDSESTTSTSNSTDGTSSTSTTTEPTTSTSTTVTTPSTTATTTAP